MGSSYNGKTPYTYPVGAGRILHRIGPVVLFLSLCPFLTCPCCQGNDHPWPSFWRQEREREETEVSKLVKKTVNLLNTA